MQERGNDSLVISGLQSHNNAETIVVNGLGEKKRKKVTLRRFDS